MWDQDAEPEDYLEDEGDVIVEGDPEDEFGVDGW